MFADAVEEPQWSRPVMGGNTDIDVVYLGIGLIEPQWSRPVMGGNTPPVAPLPPVARRAAMEPPGNGRKHRGITRSSSCRPGRRNGAAR